MRIFSSFGFLGGKIFGLNQVTLEVSNLSLSILVGLLLARKLIFDHFDSLDVLVSFDQNVLVVIFQRAHKFKKRLIILTLLQKFLLPDSFVLLILS